MTGRATAAGARQAGGPGRTGRLVASLALALGGLGSASAGPAGAAPGAAVDPGAIGAPGSAPARDRADAARQQAVSVELLDQPTWVRPGEPYEVQVRIMGEPADATIDMVVHERLEARSAYRRTLEGELGDSEYELPAQAVAGSSSGPGGAVTMGFTPGAAGALLSGRGVYPVEVRVRSAAGDVLGSVVTYLTYLKAETPEYETPLDVAVLIDIAAPPSLRPDGTEVLPPGALDRAVERIDVLRGTPDIPLTLAPRPETLEGLAQGEPPAAAAAEDLRSIAARRPVFARPFVDVDLGALQRAGLISEANAQADGGANVVRNRLGVEPTGGMWLSGPTFGDEAARLAVDLGFDRAVVPPSAVGDPQEEALVPAAPVRLGDDGPLAMVSDPALAAHLTSDDGAVAAHRFIAELAIAWLEAPSTPRAVVVHLPADAAIDPEVATVALRALADGQAARVVSVPQMFDEVAPLEEGPTSVPLAPHQVTGELQAIAPALQAARARVTGVGALLDDPGLSTSLEQSLLLSTGAETPDEDRRAYVERADIALNSVSGAVRLPDEFRITLTTRSSTIPIALDNLSERDLSVRVELESDQLEFPDGTVLTEVLAPGTTRLEVPVRVRTSGAFTMAVTVTSPDRTIILDTSTFDIRSTAISGVGIVLSIGACLFLAIWWGRHWRNARRSRHLMPPDDPTGEHTGTRTPRRDAAVPAATTDVPEAPYRPAHMARPRTRSG
jgi:hypothetical protein